MTKVLLNNVLMNNCVLECKCIRQVRQTWMFMELPFTLIYLEEIRSLLILQRDNWSVSTLRSRILIVTTVLLNIIFFNL